MRVQLSIQQKNEYIRIDLFIFCMKIILWTIVVILTVNSNKLSAQKNFKDGFEKANPVAGNSQISVEEKIEVHKKFLQKAILEKDTLRQIYGLFYLFKDHTTQNDYTTATKNTLEAELLANASGNPGWQGMVNHVKAVLQVKLKNYEASLELYKKAAEFCGKAGDSLCLAESLEQLGAINGRLNNQKNAVLYYNEAIPLIQKYGTEMSIGTTYNNYGNYLLKNDQATEAVGYYELALEIYRKNKKTKEESQVYNNLASAYAREKRYNLALVTYNKAIDLNKEHNMPENLTSNYAGLAELYEETGDYKKANEYLHKFHDLQDSLIGKDVQLEIAELNAKFNAQEKELSLKKAQLALTESRKDTQQRNYIILIIGLLVLTGLITWRYQYQRRSKELKVHQENLKQLTRILIDKNSLLTELEIQLAKTTEEKNQLNELEELDNNLYNKRILTDEDWASFKLHFEKAYPGYLIRLRKEHQALSEAEERLFLLIKLNLKTKEIASMLGISFDSVKKTRSRLRKRLNLNQEVDLEEYILNS